MNSHSSLTDAQNKTLGKRKRESAPTTTAQLLLAPPPGALTLLQFTFQEDSVEDGRIHFDSEFTKRLITDSLGLPGRLTTALR